MNDSMSDDERLSAAIDGEGDDAALDAAIDRLLEDPAARRLWLDAHRIGDAVRMPAPSALDDDAFLATFSARLAAESQVLPVRAARRAVIDERATSVSPRRPGRFAQVAIAAAIVAVAFGVEQAANGPRTIHAAASAPVVHATLQLPATADLADAMPLDYLMAHQQFAPSGRLQGVASYARTAGLVAPAAHP